MITGLESTLPSVSLAAVFGLRAAETASEKNLESPTRQVPREIDLTRADIFSVGASVYELCKGYSIAADSAESDEQMSEWHKIRKGYIDASIKRRYSRELISFLEVLHFLLIIYLIAYSAILGNEIRSYWNPILECVLQPHI